MKHLSMLLGSMTALLGMAMSGGANAATATRHFHQNASGICQPALPVFEGNIRKRPTAVANEGTANAFVSCSVATTGDIQAGPASYTLAIYNQNATAISVTCSYVYSFESGGAVIPKTLSVPGSGNRAFFVWTSADVPGTPLDLDWGNFSCNLPVGTEIGYVFYDYNYEIGT